MFSFQAMYAGMSPFDALAIYAVIAYMDSVAGVYFPKGGMHAVPVAMAAAAAKHGVSFRYNTEVASVEVQGDRASAVITKDGERIKQTWWSSIPTCPSPTATCSGTVVDPPFDLLPSCAVLLADRQPVTARSLTTTSTSVVPGRVCSRS